MRRKRSVRIAGHGTSIALEPAFWAALEDLAAARGLALDGLIAEIDRGRGDAPLASSLRVAALCIYRDRETPRLQDRTRPWPTS